MRSKPKKNHSRCGFCEKSCDNLWCASDAPKEIPYVIPLKYVTKEELENIYPRARTNSEAYIHDLIRMYGGIND